MKIFRTKLIKEGNEGRNLWMYGPEICVKSKKMVQEICDNASFHIELVDEKPQNISMPKSWRKFTSKLWRSITPRSDRKRKHRKAAPR